MMVRPGRRRLLIILAAVVLITGALLIGAVLLRRESAVPPAFDPALRNPFPATPESLAMGERVYRTQCESCHGADGRGNGPAARTLSLRPVDFGIHAGMGHSDALLFYWVSYGVPGTAMPAFARNLSPAERWHVITFIRNFRPRAD